MSPIRFVPFFIWTIPRHAHLKTKLASRISLLFFFCPLFLSGFLFHPLYFCVRATFWYPTDARYLNSKFINALCNAYTLFISKRFEIGKCFFRDTSKRQKRPFLAFWGTPKKALPNLERFWNKKFCNWTQKLRTGRHFVSFRLFTTHFWNFGKVLPFLAHFWKTWHAKKWHIWYLKFKSETTWKIYF